MSTNISPWFPWAQFAKKAHIRCYFLPLGIDYCSGLLFHTLFQSSKSRSGSAIWWPELNVDNPLRRQMKSRVNRIRFAARNYSAHIAEVWNGKTKGSKGCSGIDLPLWIERSWKKKTYASLAFLSISPHYAFHQTNNFTWIQSTILSLSLANTFNHHSVALCPPVADYELTWLMSFFFVLFRNLIYCKFFLNNFNHCVYFFFLGWSLIIEKPFLDRLPNNLDFVLRQR